jgi:hypothetical protein
MRFWKKRPFNGLDISGLGVKNEAPWRRYARDLEALLEE